MREQRTMPYAIIFLSLCLACVDHAPTAAGRGANGSALPDSGAALPLTVRLERAKFPAMRELMVNSRTVYHYPLVALETLQASALSIPFGVIEEHTGLVPDLDFAPPSGTQSGRSILAALLAKIEKMGGTWQDLGGVLVVRMRGAPSPCLSARSVEAVDIRAGISTREAILKIARTFPTLQVEWQEHLQSWNVRKLESSLTIARNTTLVKALNDLVQPSPVTLHEYPTLELANRPGDKRPFWLLWYEGRRCMIAVH
jgi:hypothetical protein